MHKLSFVIVGLAVGLILVTTLVQGKLGAPSVQALNSSPISNGSNSVGVGTLTTKIAAKDSELRGEYDTEFEDTILPFLKRFCSDCHAPGEMEGLDFLTVETAGEVVKLRGIFAAVFEQLENHSMPPKGFEQQPTDRERKLVNDWIEKTLDLKPADIDRIAPYVVEPYEDRHGNLWFGTVNQGAARYDGSTLRYFTEKDGLASNTVPSFAEDKDGNLWVGTHAGVCRFDGETFQRLGVAEGLPALRRPSTQAWASVNADNSRGIWASVGDRIFRYDGKRFAEFKTPTGGKEISSYAIVGGRVSMKLEDRKGNLWFGTDGDGAYKFDGKSFTHFTVKEGLCSNNVTSILEDQQGRIWFTCIQSYQPEMTGDGGVCRYDGKAFTRFPEIKGLSNNDIYTIYETKAGEIWIGAPRFGAYRYDGQTFTLFSKTDRPHWTRNFGLQGMVEDRNGTLWFGFSGGLFRFDGKSFFNVTKEGPWASVFAAMAEVVIGKESGIEWLHPKTMAGLSELAQGKFDQAKTSLLSLQREEPTEQTIQEFNLNQLGYQLVFSDKLDLAIEVFKLNTHLYPQSFNVFDSLGEAYWRRGNVQLAIEGYQKSLELNPQNTAATLALRKLDARRKYQRVLVAPEGWLEEVLVVPPNFAPSMSLQGLEHLRLPPEFRDPKSDWFLSYLFAIELSEPAELSQRMIEEQLLLYFRGLATGRSDKHGNKIATDKFSI